MFKWLKKLKYIVYNYDIDLKEVHDEVKELKALIGDRTTIAMDLGFKDSNYVIVAGRYNNRDYVQTFRIDADDLKHIIHILRSMKNYGQVRWVDAPPAIKAIVEREFK